MTDTRLRVGRSGPTLGDIAFRLVFIAVAALWVYAVVITIGAFARGEQGNIILRWRCETCGWEVEVETPGYAGTGYHHFPDGPCGPLVASRV